MKSVIMAILISGMFAGIAAADCPLQEDEQLLLLPGVAWLSADGREWQADIHGWVFEPESDLHLRQAGLRELLRSMGMSAPKEETELFKKRTALFLVDHKNGKTISIRLKNQLFTLKPSDRNGHIHQVVSYPVDGALKDGAVQVLSLEADGCPSAAAGSLWQIPPTGVSVVSDIDDTIKISGVGDRPALLANTFLRPFQPVPGMAELYQAWAAQGAVFHYLSAGPWPLYPALEEFLRTHHFPDGPLALKHFRVRSLSSMSFFESPEKFKLAALRELLRRYPQRDFILVGDSGEKDPETYGQIAREFGSQIRLIAIRELHPEFDAQDRYRLAFRGLPASQWDVFAQPKEIDDAVSRRPAPIQAEWNAVLQYRKGLKTVLQYVESNPDLFPPAPLRAPRLLRRDQKEDLWSVWKTFLEYVLALDSLQASHAALPRLDRASDREAFLVRYGAFVAQYRWSLEMIRRLEYDPGFKAFLNEPVAEIGLPKGTLKRLRLRFLNLAPASQFAAMTAIYKGLSGREAVSLRQAIAEDQAALWHSGASAGPALTLENGLQLIGQAGFAAWFPVQAGVSEWMGDTKVWRIHESLILPAQVEELRKQLLPGDILLERREWYLSNIGLPGYWPHAALYVGTPEERRAYFKDLGKVLDAALQKTYPKAYADSLAPFEGHPPAILEAMSEGVVFTSLEHSGAADSLAVLRPRLSKPEIAQALTRAFHYAGRPYDFNFDFSTDDTLVCSELVFKAYEPNKNFKGVHFTWTQMLGRPVSSPNMMAQQFDEEFGKPDQQLDLVLFMDGNERAGKAYPASLEAFRQSWKRPKWHIWMQAEPQP